MANLNVVNSATGTMGTKAAKRSRFEKAEVAYGKIPAAAYTIDTDSLIFNIPAKELIYARFVFANSGTADAAVLAAGANVEALEVFSGATLTSAVTWALGTGTSLDINYVIHYIRGTGRVHPGLSNGVSEVSGEYGVQIKITPTSS